MAKLKGKNALVTGGSRGTGARARDLGPKGITVNGVQPGPINTGPAHSGRKISRLLKT